MLSLDWKSGERSKGLHTTSERRRRGGNYRRRKRTRMWMRRQRPSLLSSAISLATVVQALRRRVQRNHTSQNAYLDLSRHRLM